MRWIPVFIGLLMALPAGAQPDDARAEQLKLARAAMEAQIKLGDLLLGRGDAAGAAKAYAEGVRIFQAELARTAKSTDDIGGGAGPVDAFGGRAKQRVIRAGGAAGATENAVDRGLRWLAAHQDKDGRWDADDFSKHDPADDKCTGGGGALHDVGVTGLAVLAFLGAGYTDRGAAKENPYADNLRRGLRFLITSQSADGCYGTRVSHSFMYSHALATLAVCEAYAMTKNPRYKKPAQDGLNFIMMARNPYLGWRYAPRGGDNDTSVTTWCTIALKAGEHAGLEVDKGAYEGARVWLDKVTEPDFGRAGYNFRGGPPARAEGMQDKFPPDKSEAMTAAAVFTRILCGEDPRKSAPIQKGAALMVARPPRWNPDDGSIDMCYWYMGTMAMFQVGGDPWRKWNDAMKGAIVKSQHPEGAGARAGSWDPIGPWGLEGGRVYATAMMTISLEVYYRYARVFGVR